MKKKLYYVVETEIDEEGYSTGLKNIQVYDFENNEPVKFCYLEGTREDNSQELIQEYLNDNGLGDEEFEFIQL